MRPFPVSLLFASSFLSACTAPTAEAPPATRTHVASEMSPDGGVGPAPDQRRVSLEDVASGDTSYAATMPVLHEADGTIQLRVTLNPRAHTLQKIEGAFAPHLSSASYRQLGQGVGKFDAKTGRYYFNAGYQKVRQLADGRTDNGALQEITGWLDPATNAAAVAHGVAQ